MDEARIRVKMYPGERARNRETFALHYRPHVCPGTRCTAVVFVSGTGVALESGAASSVAEEEEEPSMLFAGRIPLPDLENKRVSERV